MEPSTNTGSPLNATFEQLLSEAEIRHADVVHLRHRRVRYEIRSNPGTARGPEGQTACNEGGKGREARSCASRVETAPLPLLIARRERG
jgi:hypothetical protein